MVSGEPSNREGVGAGGSLEKESLEKESLEKEFLEKESSENAENLRGRLALMRELRTSLEGSHRVLKALDLAGIRRGTCEQGELARRLAEKLRMRTRDRRPSDDELRNDDELQNSEREVLQALRVQAALLARMQNKLRMLAHVMGEPGAEYGPQPNRSFSFLQNQLQSRFMHGKQGQPCRA